MKHIITLALVLFLTTGCSLMGKDPNKTQTEENSAETTQAEGVKKQQKGVEKKSENGYSTDDFYFESGQDGLILKHRTKKDFTQRLSSQPIESAEIIGGILMFQEKNGLQAQNIFNLEELIESWK